MYACMYVCIFISPPPPQPSHLERAIEEEPTEIFVRHEIPFDLVLVGTLLADIQDSLTTFSAHTLLQPQVQLPQLKVNKMDDITSCLDLLKGFMGAWSRDLSAKGNKMVEENRALKVPMCVLSCVLQYKFYCVL